MQQPYPSAKKPLLLLIGAGDIARRALPWLLARFRVHVLIRRPEQLATWRTWGATPILADLDNPSLKSRVGIHYPYVLHFAPPGESGGAMDARTAQLLAWLKRHSSRVANQTKCNKNKILPQQLVYISTSGVYGNCHGEWVSECRSVAPQTLRAKRRISAEQQIRAWSGSASRRAAILRVPGIYAADRLPSSRIAQGLPALQTDEDNFTNHIHADDLARIASLALFRGKNRRVYHAVDDSAHKMGDYFDLVADYLELPRPPRVSREEAREVLSPVMMSYLDESRRLTNTRLKNELRIRLRYPTVADALSKSADRRG